MKPPWIPLASQTSGKIALHPLRCSHAARPRDRWFLRVPRPEPDYDKIAAKPRGHTIRESVLGGSGFSPRRKLSRPIDIQFDELSLSGPPA